MGARAGLWHRIRLDQERRTLGAAAEATASGWDQGAVDRSPSASRVALSPTPTPSSREEVEPKDTAGSHRVGGCGPWPPSNVRSLLRLSLASWTAATSQKYHRSTWMRISQSARLGAGPARRSMMASPAAALNVIVSGNGKDRNVAMGPALDFGNTGAGVPVSYTLLKTSDEWLTVINQDEADFKIREIKFDMPDVFKVQTLGGDDVKNMDLRIGETKQFEVIFLPPEIGEYTANMKIYLDQDPEAQRTVEVHGRALFVDAHGGGGFGCSTGNGAGCGVLLALVLLRRKRRRA